MRVAWCTAHRGVMRISFFDPPPKHFYHPCPRCGQELNQMIKWQWDSKRQEPKKQEPNYTSYPDWVDRNNKNREESVPDRSQSREESIPTGELCSCCRFFSVRPEVDLCGWCVDCPTKYCDVPDRYKKVRLLKGEID